MTPSVLVAAGLILIVAGAGVLFFGLARYRMLLAKLERPWHIERHIYRHHLAFGAGIVVGATVLLVLLIRYHGANLDVPAWPRSGGEQLMLLARWALGLFAILAWVIGMIVLIRPSALKKVEAKSNRWVEPAQSGLVGPRQLGILLLMVGIVFLLRGVWLATK